MLKRCSRKDASCVTGELLRDALAATNFTTDIGSFRLDRNRTRLETTYLIRQVVDRAGTYHVVALFHLENRSFVVNDSAMVWPSRWLQANESRPASFCSHACQPNEARLVKAFTCCWHCQRCELNEILVYDRRRCRRCPDFSWPDPATDLTSCYVIQPSRLDHNVWAAVTALLAVAYVLVCGVVVRHRQSRAVINHDREMAAIMLAGIATGLVVLVLGLLEPQALRCRLMFYCLCLSFTAIYGPLLARTLDDYCCYNSFDQALKQACPFQGGISLAKQFAVVALCLHVQVIKIK